MNLMRYEQAFMFAYSMREKTAASRHLVDDVPEETKKRRLAEVIAAQRRGCAWRLWTTCELCACVGGGGREGGGRPQKRGAGGGAARAAHSLPNIFGQLGD